MFPKLLTHGFSPKMANFSDFFLLANIGQEMSFMIFKNEKTLFYAIKTQSSKSRKIDILPKGLTHGLGAIMAIFQLFFFRQYRPGKCLL